jgi:putative transposase
LRYTGSVAYRTITLAWLPRSASGWWTFTASRREAGRLWSDLTERHFRLRRRNLKWPSKARWQQWARGRYPGLHSQSVQQIIAEFCEAVESTRQRRKNGHAKAAYPWKKARYRDVVYTNQAPRFGDGWMLLPNGQSGTLRVRLPKDVALPGRLIEVRLAYRRLLLVCEVPDEARPAGPTIGVDLGVNTLLAATDGETAVLISGREAKATVQWRNKRLASLAARQAGKTKGSGRWKRLQKRKRRLLAKSDRRMNDLLHKATRQVADAFPGAKCYVGQPFNDAARSLPPKQAQTVNQASNARLIRLLDYKTAGAMEVEEQYSSQTCPVCGGRRKCRRTYVCGCGATAPRDVIGCLNVRAIGEHGGLVTGLSLPKTIKYLRPSGRSSSRGHRASSSSSGREAVGL